MTMNRGIATPAMLGPAWTTKEAHPVHIDPTLQAMIDQSLKVHSAGFKGSQGMGSETDPPFPSSTEDVTMEPTADKRSRESPDSTLKPEGKSLKTSGVASATVETTANVCAVDTEVPDTGNPQVPTIRWKPKSIPEARSLMWKVHQCMPAWKSQKLIESVKAEHVDLTTSAEATGILVESRDMLEKAVKCLEEIINDKVSDVSGVSGPPAAPPSRASNQEMTNDVEPSDPDKGDDPMNVSTDSKDAEKVPDDVSKTQESSSKDTVAKEQSQDECGLQV